MPLVLTLLAFSVGLALTVKRVGLEVYASLAAFAFVASIVFMYAYFRVFF